MWEDLDDPVLAQREKNFQRMLVNNMESVFKIFFRHMTTTRIENQKIVDDDGLVIKSVESNLSALERKKIIKTRVRPDTNVK